MRIRTIACVLFASAAVVLAQNQPTPEQLKEMYDNAVQQLQQQTERKNQLAKENQDLQARIARLEQHVAQLETDQEAQANKSFFLREHYSAWQTFVELNPLIKAMWSEYMTLRGSADEALAVILLDADWPFGICEPAKPIFPETALENPPATAPATAPTTGPASEPTTVPTTGSTTEPAVPPTTVPTTPPVDTGYPATRPVAPGEAAQPQTAQPQTISPAGVSPATTRAAS